ncbi:hypothetical protein EDB85DRAFT_2009910 [Lactarius pseudohatsudake]|nr:hypothetical protein EDB85DRAFT_2009910 [Lactarius pseudohatsudake]
MSRFPAIAMTRYTNAGRKRTYVQASFDPNDHETLTTAASASGPDSSDPLQAQQEARVGTSPEPSRKRRRRSKVGSEEKIVADDDGNDKPVVKSEKTKKALAKLKAKERAKRAKKTAADRAAASETRRLKRKVERCANTTCFACREVGHSAKDCPSVLPGTGDGATKTTKNLIGICYRCGSRKHNLARCRKPPEPDGSLPFASCFVCSGRGHLAGSCPDNSGKGVYPNGGSCKLCGETAHLAKDCTLRTKTDGGAAATLLGTGREAGADEDDFLMIRRRNLEIDRDERKEAKALRAADVVKASGRTSVKPNKVVHF